jgi:type IV pilus assembly protein PilQ
VENDRVSLLARDAEIGDVLALVAEQHGLNVVSGENLTDRISVTLSDVLLDEALNVLLAVHGYTWTRRDGIVIVSKLAAGAPPLVQGRQLRVFELNYVAAEDVDRVIKGLLTPAGKSFALEAKADDKRRTSEQVVVEDVPEALSRIESYIRRIDQPPRQVLVEAHVLQISLKGDLRHGVNFEEVIRLSGSTLRLGSVGMVANPIATGGFARIEGGDLTAVVELLKSHTDAKTLAAPRLVVLNGQQARIQIGSKLGYLVMTTTQTATLQNVNFLETGVILNVTPTITQNNQILMHVRPEVSTGRVNADTGLPDSETTEVETRVMLHDGEAIIIGGLIQETDTLSESKIPLLGDLRYVGKLFAKSSMVTERSEIIIALRPCIAPYPYSPREIDVLHEVHQRAPTRFPPPTVDLPFPPAP